MKLSVITTFTTNRQEAWQEALQNYNDLADEVIVVYDFKEDPQITEYINDMPKIRGAGMDWPYEYDWSEFPRHFNFGLSQATGDWILKLDIDLFIHEDDFTKLREALAGSEAMVASLNKQSVYGGKYFSKGKVINCLNKKRHPNLRFGGLVGHDGNDDLVGIIIPTTSNKGVPYGILPTQVLNTGVNFWNFDYTFKDQTTAERDYARMARAYKRFFGKDDFGANDEDAIKRYNSQRQFRYSQAYYPVYPALLPIHIRDKYIQQRVQE